MPGQTNERAFETFVEEILLTRGGWKACGKAEVSKLDAVLAKPNSAVERLQEYRTPPHQD